jgi:spermidine/putrescine transport system substrate-binding protein
MRSSRRQFLARSAQMGVLLGTGIPLLQACGSDDGGDDGGPTDSNGSSSGSTGTTIFGAGAAESEDAVKESIADGLAPEAGPLRLFNYPDYVNPEVVAGFEEKYGVKVEITTFDTDTESIQKLASGAVKVDVQHSVSASTIYKLIGGGLVQPLNRSYLTNFGNIQSTFTDPFYDPGAKYSVPYTIYTTGIGYRADRVDAAEVAERGWDMIWNGDYKGEISILDDSREGLFLAMMRKGNFDINTTDPAVISAAGDDLAELIDLVNIKINIEGYKDIPEGATSIAHTWNADLIGGALNYLPEGTGPEVLGYWYPDDNIGPLGNDCMCVMANADSPVLAHLYLDYLLDLQIAELNFTWNAYLPALTGLDADYLIGKGYVPENLRNAVLTTEQIEKGLRYLPLSPDDELIWEDTWSKFTAGG